ncbi:hypothetical protein LV716_04670 [Flagellimonas sp. HMM57]|nr:MULTISPECIES: hypothetical protein [unclassified Flagellimonas]MBS9460935.1 hypothetical protein [Flagellimonas sp. 389]UII77088.1 hypothetical protein LV716_04670 [Flagellimonas sp. HMM57]
MKNKKGRIVYFGFAKLDFKTDSYQLCDIQLEKEEMVINLHTPIVL